MALPMRPTVLYPAMPVPSLHVGRDAVEVLCMRSNQTRECGTASDSDLVQRASSLIGDVDEESIHCSVPCSSIPLFLLIPSLVLFLSFPFLFFLPFLLFLRSPT